MAEATISDKVAVVGVGETTYYKRGGAPEPEFVLVLRAIQRAAEDAGIDVTEIDGFASYSSDRNEPLRVAGALGIDRIRFTNMVWGGGGGGVCAAVGETSTTRAATVTSASLALQCDIFARAEVREDLVHRRHIRWGRGERRRE